METVGLISFLGTVIVVSLSGVLMPGPITTVTVARGAMTPHAGAWVSVGHGVVEWPLMGVIYLGVGSWFQMPAARIVLGAAGGLVLVFMGAGMLHRRKQIDLQADKSRTDLNSPFLAGMVLSVGNPYFLIWWATIGAALIQKSFTYGLVGFFLFALCHWLCDFVWYYFLSALTFQGGRFFGRWLQEGVFVVCGAALLIFGGWFGAAAGFEFIELIRRG